MKRTGIYSILRDGLSNEVDLDSLRGDFADVMDLDSLVDEVGLAKGG